MANRKQSIWTLPYIHLLVIEFFLQMGLHLSNPIIAGYAVSLGATVTVAGILAGLNAFSSFVSRLFTGAIADRFSKKSVLFVAVFLFTVAGIGLSLATTEAAVAVCRLVQGLAFALKSVSLVALVSRSVPESQLAQGIGWYGAASTSSLAVGPMVGSMLSEAYGYQFSFQIAALLIAIGCVLSFLYKQPNLGDKKLEGKSAESAAQTASKAREANVETAADAKAGTNPASQGIVARFVGLFSIGLLPLALADTLITMTQGSAFGLILLIGAARGIEGASGFFATFAIFSFASRPFAGWVADKYGIWAIVTPSFAVGLVGTIIMAFATNLPLVLVGGALLGAGISAVFSAMQAESVRGVPVNELGKAANTFYIGPDLTVFIGPFLGGAIFEIVGATEMFLVDAALMVIGYILFIVWHRWRNRQLKENEA